MGFIYGQLQSGFRLSHYEIVSLLGAGGMGEVYRATDTRLGRDVAVKVLPAELANEPDRLRRFEREARTAAGLNHPHICTIYDVGEHGGRHFIAMELLEGRTLRELIGGKPVAMELLIAIGTAISDALDLAHRSGIIHRDIKSVNIFITRRGQPKVLDFGLAKLESVFSLDVSTVSYDMTVPGTTLGTVAYMSPEQARGEPVDHRTDLFSFGIVLHEMATGKLPFPGSTPAVIFDAVLNRQPVGLESVHPELQAIVSKALEKDRTLRYQSASDMLADLTRIRFGGGIHELASPPIFVPPNPPRAPRERDAEPRRIEASQTSFSRRWTHHLYLKGRAAGAKGTPEKLKEALESYKRALETDPSYALAYAGMADCYALLGFPFSATMPPGEAFSHAKAAAEKALQLDSFLAQAHTAQAQCAFLYDWDWVAAERGFRRAAELSVSALNSQLYLLLTVLGRLEEPIANARQTCEQNPLSVEAAVCFAAVLYYARRYDDSCRAAQKALEMDPGNLPATLYLSSALQGSGDLAKAIDVAENASSHLHARAQTGWLYGLAGRQGDALRVRDELLRQASRGYVSPVSLAMVYAGIGDADNWEKLMRKGLEERSGLLVFLKCSTWNDRMRNHPFWTELVRAIGLP